MNSVFNQFGGKSEREDRPIKQKKKLKTNHKKISPMLSPSQYLKLDKNLSSKSPTLMQLISATTANINLKKVEFIKQIPTKKFEILKLPSNIYSYKSHELAETYQVEIGIRTAIILGSMVSQALLLYSLLYSIHTMTITYFKGCFHCFVCVVA